MKQTSSRMDRYALKEIQKTYGFMLERGYQFVSTGDADMGWQAVLQKASLFVQILHTRGDDYIAFQAGAQPSGEWFEFENVVYAATGDKIPISYGNELVKQLQRYIDRIETYFAGEYLQNPGGLKSIQEAARAAQEAANREALAKAGLTPAGERIPEKEPKRIAILYYPLLTVILLLLLGALSTLYMALLDRLLSSFSTEADFYTPYLGVVAVLLAVLTLLFLRRWIKWS